MAKITNKSVADGRLQVNIDLNDDDLIEILKGGPGSGNWAHVGRPGHVGGSGGGGGHHKLPPGHQYHKPSGGGSAGGGKTELEDNRDPSSIPWSGRMNKKDADLWSRQGAFPNQTFYHGTGNPDIKELKPSSDEANDHSGISISGKKDVATDYLGDGGNLLEIRTNVKSPLEVDYDFWQGNSTKEAHQEIYDWVGKDPKKASIGELSEAVEEIGYDAWYSKTSSGDIYELRVFDKKNVSIVEDS